MTYTASSLHSSLSLGSGSATFTNQNARTLRPTRRLARFTSRETKSFSIFTVNIGESFIGRQELADTQLTTSATPRAP